MPVNEGCPAYVAALPKWTRGRDCYEGSDAVKARGVTYLPMLGYQIKEPDAYKHYLLRALFYNAVGRTVEGLAGAVFQKAPTFTIEDKLKDDLKDVTLTGMSAETFCLQATREVLKVGRDGVLIDLSTAQQRPYWAPYRAESIVNWRTSRIGGDEVLTMVVLYETPQESDPKDPFTPKDVKQYRVLELRQINGQPVYTQTVYREKTSGGADGKKEWAPYAEDGKDPVVIPTRRKQPLSFIPFTFLGPTGTGADVEKPPLDDLVQVNLSHYRGSADLKHGLHWAALPTPWVSGRAGEKGEPLTIGSAKAWELAENGRAGMLEVAGPGFGAIRTDLQDMQKMMATLGARLLEEQPTSSETMGAVGMRHAGEHATLRTVAGAVEQAMSWALQVHSWWMGVADKPQATGAGVELNKDYFQVKASAEVVKTALLSLQAGEIAYATFYHTLQTGEWTREGITAEIEQEEIGREGDPPTPTPDPEPAGGAA